MFYSCQWGQWSPGPASLVPSVLTLHRHTGPGARSHGLLTPHLARVGIHSSGIFWDPPPTPCDSLKKPTVITHHNYHTHLHCGVARMEIPPPCLSEQRAEALSEDQYLAGNLNVLNFFHMSLQDSLLCCWGATWQTQLGSGALQKGSRSVLSHCQRLMLKIPLVGLPVINTILVENVPGSHERGWCSKAFLLCKNNGLEAHTSLSGVLPLEPDWQDWVSSLGNVLVHRPDGQWEAKSETPLLSTGGQQNTSEAGSQEKWDLPWWQYWLAYRVPTRLWSPEPFSPFLTCHSGH